MKNMTLNALGKKVYHSTTVNERLFIEFQQDHFYRIKCTPVFGRYVDEETQELVFYKHYD